VFALSAEAMPVSSALLMVLLIPVLPVKIDFKMP